MDNLAKLVDDDLTPPEIIKSPEERMKLLIEKTKNINVIDSIPIKRYFASGRELLRIANTYLDEKDMENAFLLYMRYITLFVEKLPKHPEYKNADEKDKKDVRSNLNHLFSIAEETKKRVSNKYSLEFGDYMYKKKEYDRKFEEANKLLAEQRRQDQINSKNEMMEEYLTNLQAEIDKKKKEFEDKLKNQSPEKNKPEETWEEINTMPEKSSGSSFDRSTVVSVDRPSKPFFDRSTKPSISLLDNSNGDILRKLIVPFKILVDKFSIIAQNNTDNNIETCGILCGTLKRDCFTITHILVPKQTGTSDSCTSINEEDLALEQEKYNLITMGWIHTHPTQRSFLSSIDLHTHALYQKMLPEAIAIVVAPSVNEICMYSLTEYGLEYILKCPETGFHPHPNEQNLYQTSEHVIVDDNISIDIIDLR